MRRVPSLLYIKKYIIFLSNALKISVLSFCNVHRSVCYNVL